MRFSLHIFVSLLCCSFSLAAQTNLVEGSLGRWLTEQAEPKFDELLSRHPRFQHERIRITALQDGRPVPVTDRLTEQIKRQLTQALLATTEVQLVYDESHHCQPEIPSTVLGIEVLLIKGSVYRVALAMVDTDEGIWLGGTNIVWQGRLDSLQQRAFKHPVEAVQPQLAISRTEQIVAALQAQLKCQQGIAEPVFLAIENHLALEAIGTNLRQRLSRRALVTLDRSKANSVLSVGVAGDDRLILALAPVDGTEAGQKIAELRVSGLGNSRAVGLPKNSSRVTQPAGLSAMQVSTGSRRGVCNPRRRNCVDVEFSLAEAAYLIPFYTRAGAAEVVHCRLEKRSRPGLQRFGINVSNSNQGARVGFYTLAFTHRSDAEDMLGQLRKYSSRCDASDPPKIPLADILEPHSDRFDWTAIHLIRDSNGVKVL